MSRRTTRVPWVVGSLALIFQSHAARAQQHAADNPVAAAQDAFGLTLGLTTDLG